MTLLEVSHIHTRYGAIEALKASRYRRCGRGGHADRLERGGKSTTCALSRDSPRPAQGRSRSPERTSRASSVRGSHPRNRARPRGAPLLPAVTVRENLDLGAHRRRGPGSPKTLIASMTCSPAQGARAPERRHDVRRRAADARDRARADGPAEAAAARRAVARDRPDPGGADLRDDREINRSGVAILFVEQNAKRARSRQPRLRTGDGAGGLGERFGEPRNDPGVQKAYLGR